MARRRTFGYVRKLPSGRWQASYLDERTRERVRAPWTFATKADANLWVASVETDMARGEHLPPDLARRPFEEWAQEWLHSLHVKPKTYLRGLRVVAAKPRAAGVRRPTDRRHQLPRVQGLRRQAPAGRAGPGHRGRGPQDPPLGAGRRAEKRRDPSKPGRRAQDPTRHTPGDGLPHPRPDPATRRRDHQSAEASIA